MVASALGVKKVILPQPDKQTVLQEIDSQAHQADLGNLPTRIKSYLSGKETAFLDPIDLTGCTSFQRQVWQTVSSIPPGQTRSYQWVAKQLGQPRAARAVGQALATNPLPLLIPCHRVIGTRDLGGYGGGAALKKRLLKIEGTPPPS